MKHGNLRRCQLKTVSTTQHGARSTSELYRMSLPRLQFSTVQPSNVKPLHYEKQSWGPHLGTSRVIVTRLCSNAGITGANGAGKSTLLNAILFGLGESATQLGARQVSNHSRGTVHCLVEWIV